MDREKWKEWILKQTYVRFQDLGNKIVDTMFLSYNSLKEWILDPAHTTGYLAGILYDILIRSFIQASKTDQVFRGLIGDFAARINIYTKDMSVTRCLIIKLSEGVSSEKNLDDKPDAEIIFNSPKEMILTLLFIVDIYKDLVDDTIEIKGNPNVIYRYLFLVTYLNPLAQKVKIKQSDFGTGRA